MTLADGSPLCGRIRVNEGVESLGIGAPQDVPFPCPRVATVVVDDTLVCQECAKELQAELDANQISTWSLQVRQWADSMGHRPEIQHWVEQVAESFNHTANAVRESGQE
jgi:hypothetical protein